MTYPRAEEVHVWSIAIDGPPCAGAFDELSADERRRHALLRRADDRDAYAATHSALRRHLAVYAGCLPTDVQLARGYAGKPFVVGPLAAVPLRFSISHTVGLALLAFCVGRDVGVDVERLRPLPDVDDLCEAVFTDSEASEVRATPEPARCGAFLERWARKEAVVKAVGDGLSAMKSFAVTSGPAEQSGSVARPGGACPRGWHLRSIDVGATYAAALAVLDDRPSALDVTLRRSSLLWTGAVAR